MVVVSCAVLCHRLFQRPLLVVLLRCVVRLLVLCPCWCCVSVCGVVLCCAVCVVVVVVDGVASVLVFVVYCMVFDEFVRPVVC